MPEIPTIQTPGGKFYPVTRELIAIRRKKPVAEDFQFVLYGNQMTIYPSEEAEFYKMPYSAHYTIDWGDGTVEVIDINEIILDYATVITHNYPYEGEWTVTIKDYFDGHLQISRTASGSPVTKILTPLPTIKPGYDLSSPHLPSIESGQRPFRPFGSCFSLSRNLEFVTPDLFLNNMNNPSLPTPSMSSVFFMCNKLKSVKNMKFPSNTENFTLCFGSCLALEDFPSFEGLTNPKSFNGCFGACMSLVGEAPPLWEMYPDADGTDCFALCTNLSNYNQIPASWGGGGA